MCNCTLGSCELTLMRTQTIAAFYHKLSYLLPNLMVAYLKSLMKGISTHSDKIVANRMENKRSPNTEDS